MEIIFLPLHVSCTAASNQRRSRFSVTRRSLLPPLPLRIAPMKSGRWRARSPLRMSVDLEPDQASSSSSSDLDLLDTEAQVAALRAKEKFAIINTGKWVCRSCGYIYDQFKGDPSYPVAAGTEFSQLPEDWGCPTCGAAKSYFNSQSVEVAGFAENQNFGLGTNSLTSGQKSLLIYGSLLFFFLLFLSGYFIQ